MKQPQAVAPLGWPPPWPTRLPLAAVVALGLALVALGLAIVASGLAIVALGLSAIPPPAVPSEGAPPA